MDQSPQSTQPASLETPQPKTETFPTPAHPTPRFLSKKIAIIAIVLILIIFSAVGVFAVMNLQNPPQANNSAVPTNIPTPTRIISEIPNWKKPPSTQKGFPIKTRNGNEPLLIYNLSQAKLLQTNQLTNAGGFSSGYGSTGPAESPNFLYTALITPDTNDLLLLSNETLQTVQISPKDMIIDYIAGWSPDNKHLIYVSGSNNQAMIGGGEASKRVESKPEQEGGKFYLFNIDTGTSTELPLAGYALYGFIDPTNLFLKKLDPKTGSDSDKTVIFNTKTFAKDTSIQETFGFGAGQFDFSDDGKTWTYTLSRNPTTDANIIYADFPNKEGVQIDSGSWAEVQGSKLSPNATKVAYIKREGYIRDGVPKEAVWIYDINTKEKERFADGWPYLWIDENTLLTYVTQEDTNPGFFLLDIPTKTTKKIY